eukprot:g1425.t1
MRTHRLRNIAALLCASLLFLTSVLLGVYLHTSGEDQRKMWKEEADRVVAFNQMHKTEEDLAMLKKDIRNTITSVHLRSDDDRRKVLTIHRLHKVRKEGIESSETFPSDFYKGTMYGIPLDPEALGATHAGDIYSDTYEQRLDELRTAIETKLN